MISPRHKSVGPQTRLNPRNMSSLDITHDQRESFERVTLSIFEDCTNANLTFRQTLVAIYISGMDCGLNYAKEPTPEGWE